MRKLLLRAEIIGALGEVPITAVILDKNGKCIGHGSNRRKTDNNPLGHAEIEALRQASLIKNDWRFNDCTLIVNLEPCPMCAGALIQARMGQVIYGASDPKRGALGSTIDLSKHESAHHHMIIRSGILKKEASKQIETWFQKRRKLIT
tara:strand:- start:117 stop:560 length:444 start_codon:yes stop_codon:yes gene_type:complete